MAATTYGLRVAVEGDAERVAAATGKDLDWVAGMMVTRVGKGLDDAHMIADGLHAVVRQGEAYLVHPQVGVVPVNRAPADLLPLELRADREDGSADASATAPVRDLQAEILAGDEAAAKAPPLARIRAEWSSEAVDEGGNENILGNNCLLTIEGTATEVAIPVVDATAETLLYYGAALVEAGEVVAFPNAEYPLWAMRLGANYVDGFIMTPAGKGFYLEWHTDRPHWHQPLSEDSDGYYLLARVAEGGDSGEPVAEEEEGEGEGEGEGAGVAAKVYEITGFRIPFGCAVYTRPGAIHADCGLVGSAWIVGYTDSDHFSTALVRNSEGAFVKLAAA